MPDRSFSKCEHPACNVRVQGHRYCPEHKYSGRQEAPRRNEELYQRRGWRNTSVLHRSYNPICQRIIDGVQCTRPSKVVHHLQDPTSAPSLAMDWSNLVAVCAEHHPAGQPGAKDTETYCDTYGVENGVYPHGHGPASWKGTGHMIEQTGSPPMAMHTGNVAAQNKALADMNLDALLAVELPGAPAKR